MPSWKDVVFGFKMLSSEEIARLSREHGRKYTSGFHFITFCCEPTKFLPYLMKRYLAVGGRFEKRKVLNLDEFGYADLIINCTGLGSKEVIRDLKLQAIRGQVARVKAPWTYEVIIHDDDIGNYVIPNSDCVILGGTHQVDDYNLKVSEADSAFIFQGCWKLIPSLINAETISEVVGLRPGRDGVKLEIDVQDGKPRTIHNFGHGGSGGKPEQEVCVNEYFFFISIVTLCWGCADEVLEKTIEALSLLEKSSKL